MTLAEIVSVTGLPGLYKTSGKRTDGLIATSLVDGTTKFVSGRTHLFSTLDNITIYTQEGSVELKEVLASMKKNEKSHSPVDLKGDDALKAYFEVVLPDYDKEKFYASHMKKLVSWYNILNAKGLIEELIADKPAEEITEKSEAAAEGETEKPAKKAAKADKGEKAAKPVKESKPRAEKTATKASSKPAAGGARKTVTPRKAS
ncbi:MAG: DUF5606 domain-containing protein [Bacteroidetes bacterium]|nr:DUF5606 domain-containing protein [Bacteroidota bacterium]